MKATRRRRIVPPREPKPYLTMVLHSPLEASVIEDALTLYKAAASTRPTGRDAQQVRRYVTKRYNALTSQDQEHVVSLLESLWSQIQWRFDAE